MSREEWMRKDELVDVVQVFIGIYGTNLRAAVSIWKVRNELHDGLRVSRRGEM